MYRTCVLKYASSSWHKGIDQISGEHMHLQLLLLQLPAWKFVDIFYGIFIYPLFNT